MKIKTGLILIVLFLTSAHTSFSAMPSPEEQQEQFFAMMHLLEQKPQIAKKLINGMAKEVEKELSKLSSSDLDKAIRAQPYEAFKGHLDTHEENNKAIQDSIAKNIAGLSRKEKIKLLARMEVTKGLYSMGLLGIIAQKANEGTFDLQAEINATTDNVAGRQESPALDKDSNKDQGPYGHHVIILPVKQAEQFVEALSAESNALKNFGPENNMAFSRLNIKQWNESFVEAEKWIEQFKKRIEEAKKNPSVVTIMGKAHDFDTGIAQDCEDVNIVVPIAVALSVHVEQNMNRQPHEQAREKITEILGKLPNAEQEQALKQKYKDGTTGKIAIVSKGLPKLVKQSLAPSNGLAKTPLFRYAQTLAAARKK